MNNPKYEKIDYISFNSFMFEMRKILNEKYNKFKDSWKTCELGYLKYKLDDINKNTFVYKKETNPMRKLIHIANFCYFLYTRLKDDT